MVVAAAGIPGPLVVVADSLGPAAVGKVADRVAQDSSAHQEAKFAISYA